MEFKNKYVKNGVLYIDKYVEDVDMIVGKFSHKENIIRLINEIVVEEDNQVYYCKDNCLLRRSNNNLVLGCHNSIIPNYVTVIENYAFSGCGFTKIDVPESVQEIEIGAFAYCTELKEIKLPKCLKAIDDSLFEYCNSLENVNIPDSVTYIGNCAFCGCSEIKEFVLPNSIEYIDSGSFMWCVKLEKINIPNNSNKKIEKTDENFEPLLTIHNYTFSHCENLKRIVVPKNIEFIEGTAFSGCDSLEEVFFEDIDNWLYREYEMDEKGYRREKEYGNPYINEEYIIDLKEPKQNAQLLKNGNKSFSLNKMPF